MGNSDSVNIPSRDQSPDDLAIISFEKIKDMAFFYNIPIMNEETFMKLTIGNKQKNIAKYVQEIHKFTESSA